MALAALLPFCRPLLAGEEPAPREAPPVRVLAVEPIVLPFNTTRANWERTKEVSTEYLRMFPIAQMATALLVMKTVLSTPYDIAAAPFRQKTRNKVSFEIRGRILDVDGNPAPNTKVLVRCTAPWGESEHGTQVDYYETGRFGPVVTDADGRVAVRGESVTGLQSSFMVHLDLADAPSGAGSAGAYEITVSTAGPSVSPVVKGSARLAGN